MTLDPRSGPLATPLPSLIFKVSDQFLLFGVHRNYRPSPGQSPTHLFADMSELSIPIRMVFSFLGFAIALQTVPHLPQQLGHLLVADRVAPSSQFLRQG